MYGANAGDATTGLGAAVHTTHFLRLETTRKIKALEDKFASFRRRREEEHVKELAVLRAEIVELRMNVLDPAKVSCNGDAEEEKVTVDPLLPPAQAVAIHAHARWHSSPNQ